MERNYCIYKHTCPNGKVYIGITGSNPLDRWKLGKGYARNKYFYKAIQKYGWDNIHHEILVDRLTQNEAKHYECVLIEAYQSTNPDFGYNFSDGGEIGNKGKKFSKEMYQKIWETRRRNGTDIPWNKGVHTSGIKIAQYDKQMNLIAEFGSTKIAEEKTGIQCSHINECCKGKRKSAGGFIWSYAENLFNAACK